VRAGLAAAAALVLAGCGGSEANLATFSGTWQGHTRGLVISRSGLARESIDDGCCHLGLALRFRLSDPRGTSHAATATATVTAVRVGEKHLFTSANPAPHVGQSRAIRLRDGVIAETITGTNYCSATAKHWVCGA
jgi:hypothetical protein